MSYTDDPLLRALENAETPGEHEAFLRALYRKYPDAPKNVKQEWAETISDKLFDRLMREDLACRSTEEKANYLLIIKHRRIVRVCRSRFDLV